jgi:hypothetical protein
MFAKHPVALWDELDPPPVRGRGRLRRLKVTPIEGIIILVPLAVVAGLLLPMFVFELRHDYTHRYPPPGANAGNGFAAVAGEFTLGDGRGLNWSLSILPDGRYSFRWSGCMGVYERESGLVRHTGDYLVLTSAEPIERRIPRVFLPVKWGRRTYFIPPEELEKFSEAIMKGDEPRHEHAHGDFYVTPGGTRRRHARTARAMGNFPAEECGVRHDRRGEGARSSQDRRGIGGRHERREHPDGAGTGAPFWPPFDTRRCERANILGGGCVPGPV